MATNNLTNVLPKFKSIGPVIPVSPHAVDEAVTDFRIARMDAEEWIRTNLRKASYVADVTGDSGMPARLFGYQRIAFILAVGNDYVYTVYPRHAAVTPLASKVQTLVMRELAKLQRAERAVEKRVNREKARLAPDRLAAQTTLAGFDLRLAELDAELATARKLTAATAKNVVAYI